MLIRKIQCQLKKVVMNPPTGGPVIGPRRAGMVSSAMAETSSLFFVVRKSTRRPTGVIIAPPIPCRKRAATKVRSESEMAQNTEPSMNTMMAARNTRFAP